MRPRSKLISLVLSILMIVPLLGAAPAAAQTGAEDPRVLVFSRTAEHRHGSIPDGIAAIEQLGADNGFAVDATEDAGAFTADNLARYDAVVWLSTTGDVLDDAQQAAFEAYIQDGGGYAGVHAAADTEYDWPWYGDLVGAYFEDHPEIQEAEVMVLDRVHPSTAHLGASWVRTDEWYDFASNPTGDVHVLAALNESSYAADGGMGHDHPIAWCHVHDGGRSWYTGGGHTSEAFAEPAFLDHLLGGIEYAAGIAPGDCGASVHDSYEKTLLTDDIGEPMAMKVAPDGRVFHTSRNGELRVWDPGTESSSLAGVVPVFDGLEDGLLGIELALDFEQSGHIYLHYSHPTESRNQVSRFTMDGDELDLDSEVVILHWETQREVCCHAAGKMDWGPDGTLYIATGDNTNSMQSDGYAPIDERPGRAPYDAQGSSGNTNDLRGKILRIQPMDDPGSEPGPGSTYTIPDGNLFPPETSDPELTRPEIYIMGLRNPFRMAVDQETGYVHWGMVGPDATDDSAKYGPRAYDTLSYATEAGNWGWPYCVLPDQPYRDRDFATDTTGDHFDCEGGPVNDSPNNTGLTQLPPVTSYPTVYYHRDFTPEFPAIDAGGSLWVIGGPVYRYDESIENETKFPEYWDGKWFWGEGGRRFVKTVTLDDEGDFLKIDAFLPDLPWITPHDMEFGPDGALYVLEYGSGWFGAADDNGLYRVDYTGGRASPTARTSATPRSGAAPLEVSFSGEDSTDPQGSTLEYAWTFGDGASSTEPNPTHTYTTPGSYSAQLTVTDPEGNTGSSSVTITVGNTQPEVSFDAPVEGGFFDFGDDLAYDVRVDDAEDGSTADGGIDCSRVEVGFVLGHDGHGHPQGSRVSGCEGEIGTGEPGGGHGHDQNVFGILTASYEDLGASDGAAGVPSLTGSQEIVLQPKRRQAEHFSDVAGVPVIENGTAQGGARIGDIHDGEWVSFEPVNLQGIDAMQFRVSSGGAGGQIEVRMGAPDGELVGSVAVDNTGGWEDYTVVETPIADPGRTDEMFLVFVNPSTDGALFDVDWFEALGPGVSLNARPRVSATAEPRSGAVPFEVQFSADAVDPEGEQLSYAWDFGDGATSTEAAPSHTYTTRGSFEATVTVTDPGGASATATVPVQAFAPADSCLREDGTFCVLDISDGFNNDGISTHENPGDGDFDGGGWAYAADTLPDAGPVEAGGVPFEFPSGADGELNNVESRGQVVPLFPGTYGKVHLLAASHNGATDDEVTVTYADGSTSTVPLQLTDWAVAPQFGETAAFGGDHRHDANGDTGPAVSIFHQVIGLDPEREAVYLTLPDDDRAHLFAVTLDREGFQTQLTLAPQHANPYVGDDHTVTASISAGGVPEGAGTDVTFEVYRDTGDGEHGFVERATVTADADGQAALTYSSEVAADDVVVACTGTTDCVDGDALEVTDGAPANISAEADLAAHAAVVWSDEFELEPGYAWLFDGSADSFARWQQAGPGGFEHEGNAMRSFGGLGLLWYPEQEFADYRLRLQWRTEDATDNSGVFARFPDPGDDPFVAVNQGHEIQIYDADSGEPQKTGSIYDFDREDARNSNPPGVWNDYEIEVVGQRYTVTLNGEVVNEFTSDGSRPLEGFIGLQNHDDGSVVRFRNIRIRELTGPEPDGPVFDTIGITDPDHVENGQINGHPDPYSFAAELMPDGDQVVVPDDDAGDDVPLRLPDTSGEVPNLAATNGQVFELADDDQRAYSTLHVFGAATDAGQGAASGTFTLTYADGSSDEVEVALNDWGYPGTGSEDHHVAIGPMAYRHSTQGNEQAPVPFHLYHAVVAVPSDAELVSVTWPQDIEAPEGGDDTELYTLALTLETADGGYVTPDLTGASEPPADETAPSVATTLDGEVRDDGAYVGPVTVTIEASDEEGGSGVATVEFDLDGTGWTTYDGPIEVDAPGDHTVRSRATDVAGNTSEVSSETFTIVDTPAGPPDPGPDPDPEPAVCQDVGSAPSFGDARGNFHAAAIACLEAYGLAFGSDDGDFRPRQDVSRDQMASFLQRLLAAAQVPLPASPPDAFGDDDGSVHEDAIDQLAALGVIEGKSDGRYAPREPVTRAQMASLLVRATELATGQRLPAPASPFTDIGPPHADAIDAAYAAGITRGKTATTFEPQASLLRDQMASLLVRTLQVLADEGLIEPLG